MLLACNKTTSECSQDINKTVEYLGNVQAVFLMNEISLNTLQFFEQTLVYSSKFLNI